MDIQKRDRRLRKQPTTANTFLKNPSYTRILMSILSLELAKVKIGIQEVEGLLDVSTDTFYVAVTQVCIQFSVSTTHAVREIKTIPGKGLSINTAKKKLHSSPVYVLTLAQYEKVVFSLAFKGDTEAIEFSEELIGLSLTQLFSDAFGIKFEEEDRQEYLRKRQFQKEVRLKETGCVDRWITRYASEVSVNYRKWIWCNISGSVNLALTEKKTSYWRKELNLKDDCLLRDHWNISVLSDIENIEKLASKLIDKKDVEPKEVLMIEIHEEPVKVFTP